MKDTATNGVGAKDRGVPQRWEDLRAFALVSDGGKWWLGRPDAAASGLVGHEVGGLRPGDYVRLSPAYELSDDDLWMQTQKRPELPPEKHYQGRRRAVIPACGFPSGYTYECTVRGLFWLEQLDEGDLRLLFEQWIRPAESVRAQLRKAVAAATSGITLAGSLQGLPPPPKG